MYSHALHNTVDEHKKKMTFDFERVEIIVGGESAGYQHFPLIPQCVEKPFFTGSLKFQTIYRLLNQKLKLDFQRVEIIGKLRKFWLPTLSPFPEILTKQM